MKTPRYVQYVNSVSEEETDVLRRIVLAKDEILKLTPGFREDADKFLAALRPHNGDVYLRPDEFSEQERASADSNHKHNVEVARPFALDWHLPWTPSLNLDPSYLADRPFSGAPVIEGTLSAVVEWGGKQLPTLNIEIDMRFPKQVLLQRIDDYIDRAKKQWESQGKLVFQDAKREVTKLERMLEIDRLRREKVPKEEIADRIGKTPRQVYRLDRDLRELLEEKKYWEIAPYTHMAWASEAFVARANREGSLRSGVPVRGKPII